MTYLMDTERKSELSPLETIQLVTLIIGGPDTTRVAMAVQVALLLLQSSPPRSEQPPSTRHIARAGFN